MNSALDVIRSTMRPVTERYLMRPIAEKETASHARVRFENATTALEVAVEWQEFRPFLEIAQTGASIAVEEEAGSHRVGFIRRAFDLDDLLNLRSADPSPVGKMLPSRDLEPLRVLLEEYADAIDRCAGDVLRGDLSVFAELNRIVDGRIRSMRNL